MNLSTGLPSLLERLSTETILADGAMGTMLHARGIGFDKCFDELNLTNPSAVAEIHRAYIEAGAQLIITNTFGANRFKLAKHGLEDHVVEINKASVDLAKRVVCRLLQRCAGGRRCRSAGSADRAVRTRPARAGARRVRRADRSAGRSRRGSDRDRNVQRSV